PVPHHHRHPGHSTVSLHDALPLLHGAIDQRLAQLHAGIIEQVTHGEVVAAVDHHVHAVHQTFDVVAIRTFGDGVDVHPRIECGQDRKSTRLNSSHVKNA